MTTTAKTLAQFIEASNLPAALIRAVVEQIGGWDSFTDYAQDIAEHGIDGGFTGFIYYNETHPFARANRREIAKLASQHADDMGTGLFEMIRGFGCFKGETVTDEQIGAALYAGNTDDEDGADVLNALAWYAGEEVCRAYADLTERD